MTGRELAITAHTLRVTANSVAQLAEQALGPCEGVNAAQAIRKVADDVEAKAGRLLVAEVLTEIH